MAVPTPARDCRTFQYGDCSSGLPHLLRHERGRRLSGVNVCAANDHTWPKGVIASFAQTSGFTNSARGAKLRRSPGHSHSIVARICKRLKEIVFFSGDTGFTVRYAVETPRLRAIDSDRKRKALNVSEFIRRQILVSGRYRSSSSPLSKRPGP